MLVIGPFNYPLTLLLVPLINAICAGNCCILKPSELVPNVARAISLLKNYLDPRCCYVVEGGIEHTQILLKIKFDFIFFTGSERVGKIVAKAAAENLTPVVLELGGKCPSIVDKDCDIDLAARRIVWSKWLNCGQTCVATDFALVHEEVFDRFCASAVQALNQFSEGKPAIESPCLSRIVSKGHAARLEHLLKSSGGKVLAGGQTDIDQKFIAPTLIAEVPLDAPVSFFLN